MTISRTTRPALKCCSTCGVYGMVPPPRATLPAEPGALGYSGCMKTYLAVFASVLVAELGDKTQIATLLFATDPAAGKLGVCLAASAALVLSSALAVLVGADDGDVLWPKLPSNVAGVGFVEVGVRV